MTNLARRMLMPSGDYWDFWPFVRRTMNGVDDSIFKFDQVFSTMDSRSTDFRRETKDGPLLLEYDIPGVKREDTKVSIINGNIEIRWKRNGQDRVRNFYHGDIVSASATLKDGVLRLEMETTNQRNKKVDVEVK